MRASSDRYHWFVRLPGTTAAGQHVQDLDQQCRNHSGQRSDEQADASDDHHEDNDGIEMLEGHTTSAIGANLRRQSVKVNVPVAAASKPSSA